MIRLVPCFAIVLLSSCSTTWTSVDKAQLNGVRVPPAQVAADGFTGTRGHEAGHGPYVQGGAVGAAGMTLLEGIVQGVQDASFRQRYGAAIDKLPGTVPKDLDRLLADQVSRSLNQHPFFKGKVSNASSNALQIKITEIRYERMDAHGGDILIAPVISGVFDLRGGQGKEYLSGTARGVGSTGSPNHFAGNPAAARTAFKVAADNFAAKIVHATNAKLGANPYLPVGAVATEAAPVPERGAGPITLAPMSNHELRMTKTHKFTQGWGLVGPKQRITTGGYPMQIAGTADGKTIYLGQAAVKGSVMPTIGSAPYEAIRADLQRAGIRILRQRKILIVSGISHSILETDGNAYGVLTGS